MRYQSRKSSCGPASLANALEALGIERTEDELGTLSKQDANGTSSINLRKAAEAIGVEVVSIIEQREESAGWALSAFLRSGHSAVIVVDSDTHWIAVVGMLGDRFIVADAADNDLLLYYSLGELLSRWKNQNGKFGGFFLIGRN